jgi:hypothetical protein
MSKTGEKQSKTGKNRQNVKNRRKTGKNVKNRRKTVKNGKTVKKRQKPAKNGADYSLYGMVVCNKCVECHVENYRLSFYLSKSPIFQLQDFFFFMKTRI